ncbi:MAG: RluA family pseudouridine synthase [Deltaproteobacteria bacterium]|nr:RluA family pseudouridine synthase [Deltaproteobacteria bacterium]
MSKRPNGKYKHLPKGLEIIYEDSAVIAVDKPPGMLTMGTEKEKERTAYFAVTDYVRKGCAKSQNRIFIVHRLDRETSGIVIFAKTEKAKFYLQDHWKDTRKKYLAVVHGRCDKQAGTITSYLAENKAYIVHSTSDREKGRLASTAYRVLKETRDFSLLEVDLLTGRKHQIRVHLAEIGNPIVGDRKYGKGKDGYKRLALHALSISFKHPVSGNECFFETKIPEYFTSLVTSSLPEG